MLMKIKVVNQKVIHLDDDDGDGFMKGQRNVIGAMLYE